MRRKDVPPPRGSQPSDPAGPGKGPAGSDLDAGVADAGGRLDAPEAEGPGEARLALVLVLPVVPQPGQEAARARRAAVVPGLVLLDQVALDAVQVVVAEVLVDVRAAVAVHVLREHQLGVEAVLERVVAGRGREGVDHSGARAVRPR